MLLAAAGALTRGASVRCRPSRSTAREQPHHRRLEQVPIGPRRANAPSRRRWSRSLCRASSPATTGPDRRFHPMTPGVLRTYGEEIIRPQPHGLSLWAGARGAIRGCGLVGASRPRGAPPPMRPVVRMDSEQLRIEALRRQGPVSEAVRPPGVEPATASGGNGSPPSGVAAGPLIGPKRKGKTVL